MPNSRFALHGLAPPNSRFVCLFASNSRFMRLFQAALDTPLDSPFSVTLSVHGLHFTVCAPSNELPLPARKRPLRSYTEINQQSRLSENFGTHGFLEPCPLKSPNPPLPKYKVHVLRRTKKPKWLPLYGHWIPGKWRKNEQQKAPRSFSHFFACFRLFRPLKFALP